MSYTSELKNDLFEVLPKPKEASYLVGGIILATGHFKFDEETIKLTLSSENSAFIRYVYQIVLKDFNFKGDFNYQEKSGFHKHKLYFLKFNNAEKLLNQLNCISRLDRFFYSPLLNDILFSPKPAQRAFLKGIFLSCGSILNPNSNYHLELDPLYNTVTEVAFELLKALRVKCSIGFHQKREALYIKDADSIADFLGLIGAKKKFFEFEDLRIVKQMRNTVNRRINFETANINKTVMAASKQIQSIEKLKEEKKFEKLSPELKQAAELRIAHPTVSMSKLVEKAGFPVSRSSLHRRLTRIVEMVEKDE